MADEVFVAAFAQGQPAGVLKIQFRLPATGTGNVELQVTIGDDFSQPGVTVAIASAIAVAARLKRSTDAPAVFRTPLRTRTVKH